MVLLERYFALHMSIHPTPYALSEMSAMERLNTVNESTAQVALKPSPALRKNHLTGHREGRLSVGDNQGDKFDNVVGKIWSQFLS